MTTRTSKPSVQIPPKTLPSQADKYVQTVPNLMVIMLIGAIIAGFGWILTNSQQVTGSPVQLIITMLLMVVALSPVTLGVVSRLFNWAGAKWLTQNGFVGNSNSLDVAAGINLLFLFPENLSAPNLQPRLEQLHKQAVGTIFVSPESPVSATSIAAAIGADDFIAAVTPNSLLCFIEKYRASGLNLALATSNQEYSAALKNVALPITGRHTSSFSLEAYAVADSRCTIPRPVDLLELGQRWRITKQAICKVAVASDIFKWIIVIPATFSRVGGLSWLQLTNPLNAALVALIFSSLMIVLCVLLMFFGVPNFLTNYIK